MLISAFYLFWEVNGQHTLSTTYALLHMPHAVPHVHTRELPGSTQPQNCSFGLSALLVVYEQNGECCSFTSLHPHFLSQARDSNQRPFDEKPTSQLSFS